jgi:hypothetical protein
MHTNRIIAGAAGTALAAALLAVSAVAQVPQTSQLPLEPVRERGQSVTPSFEGWYRNPDGTFTLLMGYFNRNLKETLDIPVGPNNRIEPGGPDQGQPTHFLPRRNWGVFSVTVPADFGSRTLTWTLVSNGMTNSIPLTLVPAYAIEPLKDRASGNTPPVLRFGKDGQPQGGPPRSIAATLTAAVGQPFTFTFFATDDARQAREADGANPPLTIFLSKHRGPGTVTFAEDRPKVGDDGTVTAVATFGAPGDYVLRVQANDRTGEGGGGFQCCWTNVHVKVTVR